MDPTLAATLLIALAREAPGLIAKVIAILHQQGRITPEEVVSFLTELNAADGKSFFPSLPKAVQP